jgi:hypothetical protein
MHPAGHHEGGTYRASQTVVIARLDRATQQSQASASHLISEWERGEKKPSGPSLKLLTIIKARGIDAIA